MNVEEKAGLLFITGTGINTKGTLKKQKVWGMDAWHLTAKQWMDKEQVKHFKL
ncbi:hypothetical protein [Catalinimonas niigatensis]|uniref:hypothetical protein n=1 Tax=Catalinimonas niigatensis TaxID=1397264 RepID=UPI002666F1DB|nr:hypothetical protein [Catalinimonas niigatensis]WPP50686.1 hypothetical protein PZB72_28905 [Catalinimonas niigatensis]